MNRFFKASTALLILAALIFTLLPQLAFASSSSHVTIAVSPTELTQPGNVTVSIKLKNSNTVVTPTEPPVRPTDTPAPELTPEPTDSPEKTSLPESRDYTGYGAYTDIRISNSYGASFETAGVVISAGSERVFTAQMYVSDSMFGESLVFTVSWYDNGQQRSEYVTCKVNRRNATPYLNVTRTANPVSAAEGTDVTITYTFTNTGSVTLVNIALTDRYIYGSSSTMHSISSLDPGQSSEFIYTYRMGSTTVVSNPVVTFYARGGSVPLTVTVSQLTIGLIQSQLSKEVSVGNPTPQGVKFTLYLTNNGNQKLSDLVVKDENGKNISGSSFSLAVGEYKIIEYFAPNPSTIRYLVFYIEGTDDNGTAFKDNTSSYIVRPYIDMSLEKLEFTAVTTSSMNEENTIGIEFSVANTGALELYNISVTERALGYELYKWDQLAVGASDKVQLDINIGEVRVLEFILTAEDSSGNTYTYEAHVTAEQIDVQELIPTEDPSKDESAVDVEKTDNGLGERLDKLTTDIGVKLNSWLRILGIVAACAAVAMLGLGIAEIVVRRNKRSKKEQ